MRAVREIALDLEAKLPMTQQDAVTRATSPPDGERESSPAGSPPATSGSACTRRLMR